MHELGLAQDLCEAILTHTEGKTVSKVEIGVGGFSGVNRDSFLFCAKTVFNEALNPGVEVIIRDIPGRVRCACGEEYDTDDLLIPCPECGGFDRKLIDGAHLVLESIEVED